MPNQELQQELVHERAQRAQQQLAQQTEMQASAGKASQEAISTIERQEKMLACPTCLCQGC